MLGPLFLALGRAGAFWVERRTSASGYNSKLLMLLRTSRLSFWLPLRFLRMPSSSTFYWLAAILSVNLRCCSLSSAMLSLDPLRSPSPSLSKSSFYYSFSSSIARSIWIRSSCLFYLSSACFLSLIVSTLRA